MHKKSRSYTPIDYLELLLEEAALNGTKRRERYPGRHFFGYFCSYWPEEFILAAGFEPLRILPTSTRGTPAELPAYCCSLARISLATAISGGYRDLAGVGFAHTCDTMQCLGGVWNQTTQSGTILSMVPPVLPNAPGAHRYYEGELKSLLAQMSSLADCQISDTRLRPAMELCHSIRQLVAELDHMRHDLPSPLVSALMRAGQVMPRTDYARALEAALPAVREKTSRGQKRLRVMISGAVFENDSLFQMVEELGGRVVADDTCTGFRHYEAGNKWDYTDPLKALVQRYANMPPCPCRHRGLEERINYLIKLARDRQATGAVLVIRKYCEPHAWDCVPLTSGLRSAGINTLVLELEGAVPGGQERTRLQAFLESL
ncbi:2-hydroxyacyl-CoA dehydratase subunit D [Desulfallas thermosapovorans]|uniref:Benzoyl-CoA reductase/2-hydroxyglutaryl-CoA dehydratase subunit BcrC/BadD/HgdB n=1 Tax=Desulfallas thermosapovorans DSM 6562 TaxID=1121431 RepID=A0A5S4ZR27_9FIRM|nr:2-hydroxyacyl-CoA dehydratase family protein [Desulfallas thermosapovorans]TYO95162.1 benzoyl-CoA reductase/2-hydroxyglutaryl-CoA dehydratase subunit BcrC/BadD/HgdB [Desulfallas thermosapovorans DSM 6562]